MKYSLAKLSIIVLSLSILVNIAYLYHRIENIEIEVRDRYDSIDESINRNESNISNSLVEIEQFIHKNSLEKQRKAAIDAIGKENVNKLVFDGLDYNYGTIRSRWVSFDRDGYSGEWYVESGSGNTYIVTK